MRFHSILIIFWGILTLALASCKTQEAQTNAGNSTTQEAKGHDADGEDGGEGDNARNGSEKIAELRRKVESEPWNDVLYFQLSDEYALAGKYDSSLYYNGYAIELDSTNYYYQLQKLNLLSNANAYKQEALKTAKKCVALNPGSTQDIYSLAEQYLRIYPDSVIYTLERYDETIPESPQKYWLFQAAYLVMDSCDQAMRYGKLCEAKYPKDINNIRKLLRAAQMCQKPQLISHYIKVLSEIQLMDPKEAMLSFSALKEIEDYTGIVQIMKEQFAKYLKVGKGEKGVMIAALSVNYIPKHTLMEKDLREVYERIFETPVNENLVREGILSYYEKIGDNRRMMEYIHQIVDDTVAEMQVAWWIDMINYEVKHLMPDTSLKWEDRTYACRTAYTKYPIFLEGEAFYLVSIGKLFGRKASYDSIDIHIDRKKELISSIPRREKVTVQLNDEMSTTLEHRKSRIQELSHLYSLRADLMVANGDAGWDWYYEKSLKANPKNARAMNNYAYNIALNDSTKMRKALKLSKKSLEDDPDNVSYLDTYGYILYKLKRYEKSKEVFNKLLSVNNKPPSEALLHYSQLLRAMGKKLASEIYAIKAKQAKEMELKSVELEKDE